MKTIKIFLASSEELDYDRMAFGNLVRRLDDMYEKRGIRIKLFEWEDYDSAYNDRRKQDEYNEYVCQSDIFMALFHKKAGQFTIEEFDKASEQFKATASPKVYTFCKDLKPGEEESPELKEFKERLFNEMGHYWCRYDNRESLQFQFVMQLQLVESSRMDDVKVEDGVVTINGLPVAKMENLKFAAANEDYIKMQTEIQELSKVIIGMQIELEEKQKALDAIKETPNNEALYKYIKNDVDNLIDKLQPKLNKKNKLKEDFAKLQQNFFDTAKRVAQLQGDKIDKSIKDAIDAFNNGKVKEALYILERSEDSKPSLEDYKLSKEITELKRQNQISYINKLLLWASTIMADASISIKERIKQADDKYKDAIERSRTIDYSKDKYLMVIIDYAEFASRYAHYETALKYYQEALEIRKTIFKKDNPDLAVSYNDIGIEYGHLGMYEKALEYHQKSLKIKLRVFGEEHLETAITYNNIGVLYISSGNYGKALKYCLNAYEIEKNILGAEHIGIATSTHNLGRIYYHNDDYDKALQHYFNALKLMEKGLGENHVNTATCYFNIGNVYSKQRCYNKALHYHMKALKSRENILGKEHPETATSYDSLGVIYSMLGDYDKALQYHMRALKITENILGANHSSMIYIYHNLGFVHNRLGDNDKALWHYMKGYQIALDIMGLNSSNTTHFFSNIAWTYHLLGKYEDALTWAEKAAKAYPSKPHIIDTLASVLQDLKRFDDALEQFEHCLKLYKEQENSEGINRTKAKIARLKELMKNGGVSEQ